MKNRRYLFLISFVTLALLLSSAPETVLSASAPARKSYHRHHLMKKHKKSFKKRYGKKKKTIPKDYIIRNHRRYKVW